MKNSQPGILELIPQHGKYLFYDQIPGGNAAECLQHLAEIVDGIEIVVGLGQSLVLNLEVEIPGLRNLPARSKTDVEIPSTPFALMCWLRGEEPGTLLHRARQVNDLLSGGFIQRDCVDTFKYGTGQDLTGYEDGTENPTGQEAIEAAFVCGGAAGLDGSSFVAMQQWLHDFNSFDALGTSEADASVGRRLSDNVELENAPESAHVKRTAQESFDPEAFMLRRSMPWGTPKLDSGLFFVAFGKSFDAFEAQLARMIGDEDKIIDALFQFTRPVTGSYFWCPPMKDGRLDFRALQLQAL
jgi:putative iron-dependent peroxidase